jgi:hypothetical protein
MPTPSFDRVVPAVVVAVVCSIPAGCDRTPVTAPSPVPTTSAARTAPTIVSLTLSEPDTTEVNRDVTLRAEITDADTTIDHLVLLWTASAGQISGSGPVVTWRLPGSTVPTPVDVTITLTVVESFQAPGDGPREFRVSRAAPPLRVHDPVVELSEMALRYLVTRFGAPPTEPAECLVNFSDRCAGKADELAEIVAHRARYENLRAEAALGRVTVDRVRGTAEVVAPCAYTSREIATGAVATTAGECFLTAVYEQRRWWLCSSTLRK